MFKVEQVVSKEEATAFLKIVEQLDDAYFIDRSKHFQNPSLDGSQNKYLSMSDVSMPSEVLETLKEWFPDAEELLVNRYYPPMKIGAHVDSNLIRNISIMFLNENKKALSIKDEGQWISIQDEPGKLVTFDRTTVHKVDPQKSIRHSIVILRN